MIPTGRHRVLQIHPTLRCNLKCLHCYSESGPQATASLSLDVATEAIGDAAVEGYKVLAVSGGEPLLYSGVVEVLDSAKEAGLVTSLTTHGTLLTGPRLGMLKDRLDLLAISLDGTPASHNRIRQSTSAFSRLQRNLPALRRSGIRFGFIFTLTQMNVHELNWVAHFAAENGASLLQIHPLELAGRATQELTGEHPDEIELGFAFAEALRLRAQFAEQLVVHIDVATRSGVRALIEEQSTEPYPGDLSQAVSPLVIEPDGSVVPLTYGFSRRHQIGNLYDAPLRTLARRWIAGGYQAYRSAVNGIVREEIWSARKLPILNLYETAATLAANGT